MKNYQYKHYKKLGEVYLKLADLIKYAEQVEMNKDIFIEEYIKDIKKEIIKKLDNIKYQLKEMGMDLKFCLNKNFWE